LAVVNAAHAHMDYGGQRFRGIARFADGRSEVRRVQRIDNGLTRNDGNTWNGRAVTGQLFVAEIPLVDCAHAHLFDAICMLLALVTSVDTVHGIAIGVAPARTAGKSSIHADTAHAFTRVVRRTVGDSDTWPAITRSTYTDILGSPDADTRHPSGNCAVALSGNVLVAVVHN